MAHLPTLSWELSWTPLPTLIADVINGRSYVQKRKFWVYFWIKKFFGRNPRCDRNRIKEKRFEKELEIFLRKTHNNWHLFSVIKGCIFYLNYLIGHDFRSILIRYYMCKKQKILVYFGIKWKFVKISRCDRNRIKKLNMNWKGVEIILKKL